MSRLPAWYKLYLIRRINKLSAGIKLLNHAEYCLDHEATNAAKYWFSVAKRVIR